jgi:hypothetical protein
MPTFADRGCHVVGVTDPYGRILSFLDLEVFLALVMKNILFWDLTPYNLVVAFSFGVFMIRVDQSAK